MAPTPRKLTAKLPAHEAASIILAMIELVGCTVEIRYTGRTACVAARVPAAKGRPVQYLLVKTTARSRDRALHRAARELAEKVAETHLA